MYFRKENDAYRELEIKELFDDCISNIKIEESECKKIYAEIYVTRMVRTAEFNTPLSLEDILAIIVHSHGIEFLPLLEEAAFITYNGRVEITAASSKKPDEWISYSKKVLDTIKNYKHNEQ